MQQQLEYYPITKQISTDYSLFLKQLYIMKKLILMVAFAATSMLSYAQDYTPFEWDIVRFGYAIPAGEGLSSGIAIGSEARYNVNNQISVGLRTEFALFGGGDSNSASIGAAGSYALMGDYYFSGTSSKRAFAGLGLGLFSGASASSGTTTAEGGSGFGVIPRVGYELGHLRVSAEYNLALKEGINNYIGIHLGLTLWGGYNG